MRSSLQLSVVVPVLAMLAACAQTGNLPQAPLNPQPEQAVQIPVYYLQPGDTIAIKLMLNPELNETVVVGADGHISTSVVPDIMAAGKTIPQLRADLLRAYSRELQKPRLSVAMQQFAPTRIYVGGEVGLPGEFATGGGPPLRLSQAIARAGGVKPSADTGRIFIIRAPSQGATPQLFATRYDDITHAIDGNADVTLAPFDMVYVPKSGIAEVYAVYQQYIQQFANPSFSFTYLVNPTAGNVVTQGGVPTTVAPTTGTR